MSILADHEGLGEMSRLRPAAIVAVALAVFGGMLFVALARRNAESWYSTTSGRLAASGLLMSVVAGVVGLIPRETRGGNTICGPVLHLFRTDSASCAGVLDPLPLLVAGSIGIAACLMLAAVLVQRLS